MELCRLEVIHDKIPNSSMATQTHNDTFRSFDYLHIKESGYNQRNHKYNHANNNCQSCAYCTKV
jgi:hypothetical protein